MFWNMRSTLWPGGNLVLNWKEHQFESDGPALDFQLCQSLAGDPGFSKDNTCPFGCLEYYVS